MWTVQPTYADPGAGTGLAEHASAGSGARVVSTEVSPGQVLPGLQTPRFGGPLGPSGSSRSPSPAACIICLCVALVPTAGWAGDRPGPGTGAGRDRLSPRRYDPRAWEPAH